MSQLKVKTLLLDNSILELMYNVNITMFKDEISNDTLEDAVLFKKMLNKNIYNYETFKFYIKKINRLWNEILTDNFKNLIVDFDKSYKNYSIEKNEYEKYLIKFASKRDEKNLFKFMESLSLKPKKTIKKKLI
jgi:uncharacterized protein YaaW (UPF0174 family)